ncbi:cancer/testis antigen 55 [Oryctolagus cuniculus]|uniref:Uncharacterized protein n=1 Tax=Oryctolagus cuniculus TaxID=9986 RepID=U3KLW2_RABIT|nr:cancer/testis antigen 55 [Oryctolagus cuniculus]
MLKLARRMVTFFGCKSYEPAERQPGAGQDDNLENQRKEVTNSSGDYDLGRVLLRGGQKDAASVEECELFEVMNIPDDFYNASGSDPEIGILIDRVSTVWNGVVYMNETTSFSINLFSEGFKPYKGDWLEVEYSFDPCTSNIRAHSAKPLNFNHVKKVWISNVLGRNGVIANTVFFTLDSLILPEGYMPEVRDAVNVNIVKSDQGRYIWRAVSVTPVEMMM